MAQTYTVFLGQNISLWQGDLDHPFDSDCAPSLFIPGQRWDALASDCFNAEMAAAETRNVNLAGLALAEDFLVMMLVDGYAKLTITGQDYSGDAVTGVSIGRGNTKFPGMVLIKTGKATALQVASLANGTKVKLFAALVVAPSDTRLL